MGGADPRAGRAVRRLLRRQPGADRQQPGLDRVGLGAGLPPRHRQALPGQPDAGPRRGPQPAGGGHLLHRVLLRPAAVLRLPRAVPQLRLHAADRRQRPVGQHHRRRRAVRRAEGARVHALATPLLTKADGTKFGKTESGTVWLDSGDDLPVRVPPVLPERRGREGHRVPQGVQPPEPGPRSPNWPARRPSSRTCGPRRRPWPTT